MNTKSQSFRNTMIKAQELQASYDRLGAKSTQNVRNPIPMRKLILTVLPTLPAPTDKILVEYTANLTTLGKRFNDTVRVNVPAHEVLGGHKFWEENALSVDDVMTRLQAQGFIVNRGSVAMTLSVGKYRSHVNSVQFQSVQGIMGRPISRYFVQQA